MAKYSQKVMGKEVGQADVYAEPHSMAGQKTDVDTYSRYTPGKDIINELNVSVGGISKGNYKPVNPYGTGEMRGYGAATKGRKISGKMG
jgi:hypothetical protein